MVLVHRDLLQRDEIVLRHLLQQELKKAESLKATEAKVVKLREQLQASEKILTANRTLLKKLQEQVPAVTHVSLPDSGCNTQTRKVLSFLSPAGAACRAAGVPEEDPGGPTGAGTEPGTADCQQKNQTANGLQSDCGETRPLTFHSQHNFIYKEHFKHKRFKGLDKAEQIYVCPSVSWIT